ncbi:MAG: class I SAM-dependent methyltransferase, partial [bacterium]
MDKQYLNKATNSRHWELRENQAKAYLEVLHKQLGDLDGLKLLDVGCAAGIDVAYFADHGIEAEGVDLEASFIKEASKKYPNLKFSVGDAENLPYENSTFDIVFCINTLFYTDLN